jgi:hypothetical protein
MAETKQGTVVQKIALLRNAVNYLQKKKHEGAVQYAYTSSSQVLGSIRAEMEKLSLIVTSAVNEAKLTPFVTKNGAPQFITELWMTMTWVDTESGETLAIPWYAQGVDNAEKGPGKALTYAEKYFVLKQLNIPTDKDDPDAFQEANQTTEQKQSLKANLLAELKMTADAERVKAIWSGNPSLKADEEFIEAVRAANVRLNPKPAK